MSALWYMIYWQSANNPATYETLCQNKAAAMLIFDALKANEAIEWADVVEYHVDPTVVNTAPISEVMKQALN